MKKSMKRTLALLLTLCMVIPMALVTVSAEAEPAQYSFTESNDYFATGSTSYVNANTVRALYGRYTGNDPDGKTAKIFPIGYNNNAGGSTVRPNYYNSGKVNGDLMSYTGIYYKSRVNLSDNENPVYDSFAVMVKNPGKQATYNLNVTFYQYTTSATKCEIYFIPASGVIVNENPINKFDFSAVSNGQISGIMPEAYLNAINGANPVATINLRGDGSATVDTAESAGQLVVNTDDDYVVVFRPVDAPSSDANKNDIDDKYEGFANAYMLITGFTLTEVESGESTGTEYYSVDGKPVAAADAAAAVKAINDVESGEVKLLTNIDAGDIGLTLKSGVTLDLNGKTLTVASVAAQPAQIKDSATDSADGVAGALVSAAVENYFNSANEYLPLKNGTGYSFYKVTAESKGTRPVDGADAVSYGFRLNFTNTAAYALLRAEDLEIYGTLTVGANTVDWIFEDTGAYIDKENAENKPEGAVAVVVLTVLNIDAVGENAVVVVPTFEYNGVLFSAGEISNVSAS